MKINTTITWVILLLLTVASALISKMESSYIVLLILMFSVFKFFGIAFEFMELKKAHVFWKVMVVSFLFIFATSIVILI